MKVILQQDVSGQGKRGQMVNVSDGYARNYLLPRKLAVEATADNLNTMRLQEKAKLAQLAQEKADAEAAAARLEGCVVKIPVRVGAGGKMFGSVTSREISEALAKQYGIEVEKNRIIQTEPIKTFGTYAVKCKLGFEISGVINVIVTEDK